MARDDAATPEPLVVLPTPHLAGGGVPLEPSTVFTFTGSLNQGRYGEDELEAARSLGLMSLAADGTATVGDASAVRDPRAAAAPTLVGRLGTRGRWFVGEDGRTVLLRGVNLGGDVKAPAVPDERTFLPTDFSQHASVSFVGRPFPLSEAPVHFNRLRHWGCVRGCTRPCPRYPRLTKARVGPWCLSVFMRPCACACVYAQLQLLAHDDELGGGGACWPTAIRHSVPGLPHRPVPNGRRVWFLLVY
jgi:hypothetical protein